MAAEIGRLRVARDGVIEEIQRLQKDLPADAPHELAALSGVSAFPARHKCARLPWKALMGAVKNG